MQLIQSVANISASSLATVQQAVLSAKQNNSAALSEYDFQVDASADCSALREFVTTHSDVIYDISFASDKKRLATCSSDESVCIWTLDKNGTWVKDSTIREHGGTAWKVTWGHTQFEQMLATCSFDDKRARLFEAVPTDNYESARKRWVTANSFEDKFHSLVTDVKFAPPHMGLVLGLCSVDGCLRLLAPEGNLKSWKELTQFVVKSCSLSCLAFSESTRDRVFVGTGADLIRSEEISSQSSDLDSKTSSYFNLFYVDIKSKSKMSLVAVDDSQLHVKYPVTTCCFSPTLGRSFQLLAIGSKHVVVFQIKSSILQTKTILPYPDNFNNPNCFIWRVAWNITGTQLVGSTTNGNVFVWRFNSAMKWNLVSRFDDSSDSLDSIERPLANTSFRTD